MATPATEVKPTTPAPPPQPPTPTFKDEGKDVSASAMERNELGIKNNTQQAPSFIAGDVVPDAAVAEVTKQAAPSTEAPPVDPTKTDEPAKLLAGKYKTVEELEKGYLESQKGFMSKVEQEAAKKAEVLAEAKVQEKLKSLVTEEGAATQAASQLTMKPLNAMSDDELLDLQVRAPKDFIRLQQQETLRSIRASQVQEQWKRDNKDLLDMQIDIGEGKQFTGEALVSSIALALAKERPDLLNDGTGEAILRESTGHVRNLISTFRNQGKQEALIVRETVTPLQATIGSPATSPGNQPQAAPTKDVDPLTEEVERRRAETKRISAGSAVMRY